MLDDNKVDLHQSSLPAHFFHEESVMKVVSTTILSILLIQGEHSSVSKKCALSSGLEVIQLFPCSAQLTIVGILTFMSRINY